MSQKHITLSNHNTIKIIDVVQKVLATCIPKAAREEEIRFVTEVTKRSEKPRLPWDKIQYM